MSELLPCPFCGWGDPSWHVEHFAYDFEEYAVHCGNCDAESAMFRTREDAAAAWNRRTTLPTAPQLEGAVLCIVYDTGRSYRRMEPPRNTRG